MKYFRLNVSKELFILSNDNKNERDNCNGTPNNIFLQKQNRIKRLVFLKNTLIVVKSN